MKISVVTVCYNAEDLIEDTIRSVVNQTYPDIEYIVIDGASTDGTIDIIRRYSDKISYWISEKDKGIYDAMNKGIAAARGSYVIFMNAGDKFSNSNVIANVTPKLGEHTIVSGRWKRCYADGKEKSASPQAIESLKVEMPICHQATFVKLSYHKTNPFDVSFRLSADYDFFYKAWRKNETFYYINDLIVDFLEDQGASTDNIAISVKEREKTWEGENNLILRKLHLRYQIFRIKTVKLIKKLITHTA